MAKSWQYPRWRRVAMQASMWLILAATVGLAALVNRHQRHALVPPLDTKNPVILGNAVKVALPAHWSASRSDARPGDTAPTSVQMREPVPSGAPAAARTLAVSLLAAPAFTSPREFLYLHGLSSPRTTATYTDPLEDPRAALGPQGATQPSKVINVGGWPGLLVFSVLARTSGHLPITRVTACAILPSRRALLIELAGSGLPDQSDFELVENVAAHAQFLFPEGPAPSAAGGAVDLHGGLLVRSPDDFLVLPNVDPDRTDRLLLLASPAPDEPEDWTAIDLVPCRFFPPDPRDPPETRPANGPTSRPSPAHAARQAVLSLLAAYGSDWGNATVSGSQQHGFRIDLPASDRAPFPTRAYLAVHDDGRALLAVFHGSAANDRHFEPAWSVISDSLRFDGTAPPNADLLAAGSDEAKRLSAAGLAQLLAGPPEDEWLLWYRERPTQTPIGWTQPSLRRTGADTPAQPPATRPATTPPATGETWSGTRLSAWLNPDLHPTKVEETWSASDDLTHYTFEVVRSDAHANPTMPLSVTYHRTLTIGPTTAPSNAPAATQPAATHPLPPNFVAGGPLPYLISQLSPRGMALVTDSFAGYEGYPSTEMFTLIVHPPATARGRRPARASPASDAADKPPERCVTIEVNGSGRLTHWYFKPDGALSHVDLSPFLRRSPTNSLGDKFDDPRLSPD